MADTKNKTIIFLVNRRHKQLFKDLNNIHIFVSKAVPLLQSAAKEYKFKGLKTVEDISFLVPGVNGKIKIAKRNGDDLCTLLQRFANRELYENLLVSSVSRFEFYLSDIIRYFLLEFPSKLTIGPKGGDSAKQVPMQLIVKSNNYNDLLEEIIDLRLQTIFYAEPKEYCAYFNAVSELGVSQDLFASFFEIKATRDLIIHNSLVINDLYIKKAGDLSRGQLGEKLKITKIYFENSLSIMKTLSTTIEKTTREKNEET